LPRSQPGEFAAVLLDLDVDADATPSLLVDQVQLLCPETPVFAIAGVDAPRRLFEALQHPSVAALCPKLPADAAGTGGTPEGPDEQDLTTALRRRLQPDPNPVGPAPYLAGDTPVSERVVGSTLEKEDALDEVLRFAQKMGLGEEKLRRIEVAT